MKYIIRVVTKIGEYSTGVKDVSDVEYLGVISGIKDTMKSGNSTMTLYTNSNVAIYIPHNVLKNSVILVTELSENSD